MRSGCKNKLKMWVMCGARNSRINYPININVLLGLMAGSLSAIMLFIYWFVLVCPQKPGIANNVRPTAANMSIRVLRSEPRNRAHVRLYPADGSA